MATSSNKVAQSTIIPVTHPTMIPADESLLLSMSGDPLIVDVIYDESLQLPLLAPHDLVITGVADTHDGSQLVLLRLTSYNLLPFVDLVKVHGFDESLSPGDSVIPVVISSDAAVLMVLGIQFVLLMVVNIVVVDLIIIVILFCDVTRSVIILDEVVSTIFAVVLSIKSAVLIVITTAVITALDRIIVPMCGVVVEAVNGITTVLGIMVFTVTIIAGDVNGIVDTSVGQEISITNIA